MIYLTKIHKIGGEYFCNDCAASAYSAREAMIRMKIAERDLEIQDSRYKEYMESKS